MKPEERDLVLLKEILDLLDLTIDRAPKDKDAFLADLDKRDATTLRVQAIGEYLRSLSETFREAHPELPWQQAIGMRNIIAHEYGKVDYTIVWQVVTGEPFRALRDYVASIAKEQTGEST